MRSLFFLLAIAPLPVFAAHIDPPGPANAWDYYVIAGNVPVIAALLESIKAMTSPSSNPEFRTLVATFASIGFFGVVFTSIRGGPERIGKYIVGIWLLTYALFSLTLDLVVTDETNSATQEVKDVPAAVGLPAAAVATVGQWLTEKTELFFSLPNYDGLKLSSGAFVNMNAMMLNALHEVRITEPNLRDGINRYVEDCVVPAVISLKIDPKEMLQSKDMWALFAKAKHNSIYTTWYGNFGTCDEAYTDLTNKLTAYAPSLTKGMGESFSFLDATGAGNTFIASALDSSLQWSSTAGGTGNTYALQQGMLHAWRDSYKNTATALGANEELLSLNIEQAKEAQRTGWYTTAELFKEAVMYMYALMQAFIIGLAPIVMAASVLPKVGFSMMKGWAEVLVWLALWAPAFALINFIMAVAEQNSYRQILGGGLNLMSDTAMSEATVQFITVAGLLMTLVPVILWGLVSKGSIAMTSALERASGASQAGGAAQKTAEGSFSAGNVSYDNMNANHHDLSQSRAYGVQPTTLHNGAGATTEITSMSGNQLQVGGVGQTVSHGVNDGVANKQAVQRAWGEHKKSATMLSDAATSAFQFAASHYYSASVGGQGARSTQYTESERRETANQQAFEAVYSEQRGANVNHEQAFSMGVVGALRSGGFKAEAAEYEKTGDAGVLNKLGSKLQGKGLGFLTNAAGLSSQLEAKYSGSDKVSTGQEIKAGHGDKVVASTTEGAGQQSQRGSRHDDVFSHNEEGKRGTQFSTSRQFQALRQRATEFYETQTAADTAEKQSGATESRTTTRGMSVAEYGAAERDFQTRMDRTDATVRAGELGDMPGATPFGGRVRAAAEKDKADSEGDIVAGVGVIGAGGADVLNGERAVVGREKRGEAEQLRLAQQQAVNPADVNRARADSTDATNNAQLTAAGKWLREAESMEGTRGAMFAMGAAHYAVDKLPFGPAGNLVAGGIAAGGVYLVSKLGPNEVEEKGGAVVQEFQLKPMRDITDTHGHVVGHAAGFALDRDGNASTIYRYETGEKDASGHKLTAFGVWKEGEGFAKIDGLDFADKEPGKPAGVNYSGGTKWRDGYEPKGH
jgi:conjugal transfer mating pair stabilization protein TraG